jgi:hypothetical protein
MSWFERIFRRRRLDDDLAEELQEHIAERTEQIMRSRICLEPRRVKPPFAPLAIPPWSRRAVARSGNGPGLRLF